MANPASGQMAERYLKEQVETASPEQLMLMLYDGAIKFMRVARKAMTDQEWEKAHNNLIKAQNILTELMISLNLELGGEVARNLYRLYDYYIWALVQANIHRNLAQVDEVLDHVKNLKQTWEQAIVLASQEKTPHAPTTDRIERSPGPVMSA